MSGGADAGDPGAPDLALLAARFGGLLHAAGVPVTAERGGRLARALALRPPATVRELYWTARVTLLDDRGQIETFERVFAQVFAGIEDPADWRGQTEAPADVRRHVGPDRRSGGPAGPAPSAAARSPRPNVAGDDPGDDGADDDAVLVAASAEERLRHRDFATLDPEELQLLRTLTARVAFAPPPRVSRRRRQAPSGDHLDVRATLRSAWRTGGDPYVTVSRRRRTRPRRLVLLCDISGSMEPYTRAYLHLLLSGVGGARAEAFVFATRLTRLTRALRGPQPELALERAGRAAPDWSGGTRIGEALRTFNDDHGRRGLARGAVVVVLSDGWDRGDPELLAREMQRLRRLAYRIVWVNPRRSRPAFQPLTGGMAAALPHVDAFVSGHSLAAFDEVLAAIGAV